MRTSAAVKMGLAALGVLVALTACSREPVKVAIMTKLESGSLVGTSEYDAVRLYMARSGLDGIVPVPVNDGWDPAKIPAAWDTVRSQGISIVITSHTSTCAVELKKLSDLDLDKALVMVTGSTTDVLSGLKDNNIRVVQDVNREQRSMAEQIAGHEFARLAVIRDIDNIRYSDPAWKVFSANYPGPVAKLDVSVKNLDLVAVDAFLRSESFDALYTLIGGNQTASGSLGQYAFNLNPGIRIFFTPWNNAATILETAGPSIARSTMASHYAPRSSNPALDEYFREFKAAFGYVPTYNSAHVYRAFDLVAQAVKAGCADGPAVRRWLSERRDYPTVFGPIRFDEFGDVDMPLFFIEDVAAEYR